MGVDLNDCIVLVVDDNAINRKVLLMTLEKVFQVSKDSCRVAENGEEAVQCYEKDKPRIIFMDCMMPVMNGYDATIKIRELEGTEDSEKVKIIAVTADHENNPKKSLESGMDECVLKPYDAEQLKKAMRKVSITFIDG